jgi:hypothetical protein
MGFVAERAEVCQAIGICVRHQGRMFKRSTVVHLT